MVHGHGRVLRSLRSSVRPSILISLLVFFQIAAWWRIDQTARLLWLNSPNVLEISLPMATTSTPITLNRLRFDWTNLSLMSKLALQISEHQTNCSLPIGKFWFRNRFGLGSDLHVWSQGLCNAMDQRIRITATQNWLWNDQSACQVSNEQKSTLGCYFPKAEPQCPGDVEAMNLDSTLNLVRGRGRVSMNCSGILLENNVSSFRTASTEYLFSRISPMVLEEANRQMRAVFPNGIAPPNLITVHIRWGDKADEMKLVPIEEYIHAVEEISRQRVSSVGDINIFLATEDPEAVKAFRDASHSAWNIYVDSFHDEFLADRVSGYNGAPRMAVTLKGRPGLVALGSLLVSMEANDFVLTTTSNWSRLINELRQSVIDSRCGGCTTLRDLRTGQW